MTNRWMGVGAVLAGLGVAAGAFGAHGLEGRVAPDLLEVFETGARYHVIHALALLVVGLAAERPAAGGAEPPRPGRRADLRWWNVAAWLFTAGILVFAGSLYALALTGQRWLGAVTPIGGACFLAGWAAATVAAFRSGSPTGSRTPGPG